MNDESKNMEESGKMLASIQKIEALEPIEGADQIEAAKVLGWTVIVRKGQFKVGARCCLIQVDSIVPNTRPFAFLGEHRHIKTKKLKGCLSQGLVMPFTDFEQESLAAANLPILEVNSDITEILGIKKYIKDIPLTQQGLIRGNFPSYVPKTDEERIQNYKHLIDEFRGLKVYVSVKMNGSSGTYAWHDDLHVCSRNYDKKRPTDNRDIYWDIAYKHDLESKLATIPDIAIQGELCGPNLLKNMMNFSERRFLVFNAFDIKAGKYFDVDTMLKICNDLKLEHVPIIYKGITLEEILGGEITLEGLLKLAEGNYEGTTHPREGIVIRPVTETYSHALRGRMSCKVLNNQYLLKVGE